MVEGLLAAPKGEANEGKNQVEQTIKYLVNAGWCGGSRKMGVAFKMDG